MHVRTGYRRRTLDEEKRSIAAVSQPCHLGKQAPISQGSGEISDRFALDEHLVVNQVVASRETRHPYFERAALTNGIKQRRPVLGMVDSELMDAIRHRRTTMASSVDSDQVEGVVSARAPRSILQ